MSTARERSNTARRHQSNAPTPPNGGHGRSSTAALPGRAGGEVAESFHPRDNRLLLVVGPHGERWGLLITRGTGVYVIDRAGVNRGYYDSWRVALNLLRWMANTRPPGVG